MGQFYKGKKIGTCKSMYSMRLETAQELAKQGAKDDDGIKFSTYLTDNVTRWRFPFPDEDEGIAEDCKFNKGIDIPVGSIEVFHDTITFHNCHERGGNGVNVFMPCIHSEEFKKSGIELNRGGAGEQYLTVLYQAIRNGKEKTIFACARCGRQQRFSDDDIVKIKGRAVEHYNIYKQIDEKTGHKREGGNQGLYEYAMEIIKRIK